MRITASYGWADGSSIDVIVDDDIEDYHPIRTSELGAYTRDLLRQALADREHERAEHEKPAE